MTREEVNSLALEKVLHTKCLILELSTGFGKSKIALDCLNLLCENIYKNEGTCANVLILISKKVHRISWLDEMIKWGGAVTDHITFSCYESMHKHKDEFYDIIIADEMQHLSPKRLEVLKKMQFNNFIGLSATIKRDMRDYFKCTYHANIISCGLKEAIDDDVLPEPTVYLLPLKLDDKHKTYRVQKFKKTFIVTQKGYYDTISQEIEWYKNKTMRTNNIRIKNIWLSKAGKRLKWCAEQKEDVVLALLDKFKRHKTLTFCNNIEQSKRLGKYSVTSDNKDSLSYYELFNNDKIKHLTAVSILNEGVNLVNCKIGIFCNYNKSEIVVKQRLGK